MKKKLEMNSDVAAAPLLQEEIATIAHSQWEADGCPEGKDLQYWLQAEAQLTGERTLPLFKQLEE